MTAPTYARSSAAPASPASNGCSPACALPESCTYEQLDEPVNFDLADVLGA
ncbi:hypothetical protein [Phytohabitans rumicis]|uniref:hypothetical protein n=1 Tax=Phytohabitans rumicis TaxID=1076125 RepID=UPI001563A4B8|nr:hypothetical protein [Phytohabitans rumicis]